MKLRHLRALAIGSLILLCSCYTINLKNPSGVPMVQMGPGQPATAHFSESRHAHFLIEGLISVGQPDLKQLFTDEISVNNGKAITNLSLTTTHSFIDLIVGIITVGIYTPVTVEIEGDVVPK